MTKVTGQPEEGGYEPPQDFEEIAKESLMNLDMTDSTELWLIKWPKNQNPDYDGLEVSLKLSEDGKLSNFEGSSGKEYDLVTTAPGHATVFVSSASGTKLAGSISRQVSLVHYPDPSELKEREESQMAKSLKKSQISSSLALSSSQKTFSSSRGTKTATPTRTKGRSAAPTRTIGRSATPTHSTIQRSEDHNGGASPGRGHSGTSSGQDRSKSTTSSGERTSKKIKTEV